MGRSGLKVSRACLGTMNFGTASGLAACDEIEARTIIDAFLAEGGNFVDTADLYSGGEAEQIVGRALGGRRDEVVVATKAFMPQGPGPNHRGLSRLHLTRALDASLRTARPRDRRVQPARRGRPVGPLPARRGSRAGHQDGQAHGDAAARRAPVGRPSPQ
jgi:hypothetical protein